MTDSKKTEQIKDSITLLKVKHTNVDTGKELIVFLHKNCPIIAQDGLEALDRVKVWYQDKYVICTLNIVDNGLVSKSEAGLSKRAVRFLNVDKDENVRVTRTDLLKSFSYVRAKMFGNKLKENEMMEILQDIVDGTYSTVHTSAFLTICSAGRMDEDEIASLTKAMVEVGKKMEWNKDIVVDKHCIGGLPGNRTTPIVISIVAAHGLTIPKTSSRSITSPAGTADTMEVIAPVEIDMGLMRDVVEKENGCLVWGGSTSLSPADDILIRVEKILDLDSEGQMIASVMSKKIAAGSTHVVIDIPIGPTAKVRDEETAKRLRKYFVHVGNALGIEVKVMFSDGTQPVGNGIGPALEARDVVSVLKCDSNCPCDLRERALQVAAKVLEFAPDIKSGQGYKKATEILESGAAWEKFKAICNAQGGMREIPKAKFMHPVKAKKDGKVEKIDNRKLSQLAKMAGAPVAKVAGVDLHHRLGDKVKKGDILFTIHAESQGEIDYALKLLKEFEVVAVK